MQVLGLTGFAGSGKSTVANYLVEAHGFTRLSFAAPLKKMLRTLDPLIGGQYGESHRLSELFEVHDEAYIKTIPQWGTEYRRLLQVLGTDCIRAVDPDFWVKAAVAQMTQDVTGKYVFDDVRFPNEASAVYIASPKGLWNVQRPGYKAVNGHVSEKFAGRMGESFHVVNDASVEELHAQLDMMLEFVFPPVEVRH